MVKNLPANAGAIKDPGSIPGSGRSSGERNGNPLQYSCLEKRSPWIPWTDEDPVDRGAWKAAAHGIAKSQTRLKLLSMHILLSDKNPDIISILQEEDTDFKS